MNWLSLHCNQLTALPDGFSCLTGLQFWDASFNKLTVLPDGISCLTAYIGAAFHVNRDVASVDKMMFFHSFHRLNQSIPCSARTPRYKQRIIIYYYTTLCTEPQCEPPPHSHKTCSRISQDPSGALHDIPWHNSHKPLPNPTGYTSDKHSRVGEQHGDP